MEKTSVFDLPASALQPIVEQVAGETVGEWNVFLDPRRQTASGGCADALVATFSWATRAGKQRQREVFVKRFFHAGHSEQAPLQAMERLDFPVPRSYGFLEGASGEAVCFLERLDPIIPRDSTDEEHRKGLLSHHARLLCLNVPPELASRPLPTLWHGQNVLESQDVEASLRRLWASAARGELGEEFARLCADEGDIERMLRRVDFLLERIEAMPRRLINGEMGYGYRQNTAQTLAFDWHTLFVGPRLAGVSVSLGAPEGVHSGFGDAFCPGRDDYIAHFVREVERFGGPRLGVEQAKEEAGVLAEAFYLSRYLD